jgi:hypothetical protein
VSPTIFQPEYQLIINAFNNGLTNEHIKLLFEYQDELNKDSKGNPDFNYAIQKISENLKDNEKSKVKIHVLNNIPDPSEIYKENTKTVLILDDLASEKDEIKNAIGHVFIRSRPYSISVIYLSQSFTLCDKQLVREQSNVFILFKHSPSNLKTFYDQKASTDFDKEKEFKEFANNCVKYDISGKPRKEDDIGCMIMIQNRNENKYYNGDVLFTS